MRVRFTRSAIDTECAAGCGTTLNADKVCIVMEEVIAGMFGGTINIDLTFCVPCFTEAVESLEVQCLAHNE